MREIKALSRTICSRTSRHVPDFEIKADNRRFHNLSVSLITDLEHEDSAKVIGISCRDALSARGDSGLVFSRRVRYRLVWAFSIPVDSPRDKRGIVWSGNRGLRIGIRAYIGRFCCSYLLL